MVMLLSTSGNKAHTCCQAAGGKTLGLVLGMGHRGRGERGQRGVAEKERKSERQTQKHRRDRETETEETYEFHNSC